MMPKKKKGAIELLRWDSWIDDDGSIGIVLTNQTNTCSAVVVNSQAQRSITEGNMGKSESAAC